MCSSEKIMWRSQGRCLISEGHLTLERIDCFPIVMRASSEVIIWCEFSGLMWQRHHVLFFLVKPGLPSLRTPGSLTYLRCSAKHAPSPLASVAYVGIIYLTQNILGVRNLPTPGFLVWHTQLAVENTPAQHMRFLDCCHSEAALVY